MSKTPGQSKQRPISAFFTPVPKTSSAKKSGTPMDAINKPELKTPSSELIGKKLQVFWPIDSTWYSGSIVGFDSDTGKHQVRYDDGDQESLELAKEKYEILEGHQPLKTPASRHRRQKIIHDDSDEENEIPTSKAKDIDDDEWEMESEADDDQLSDMDLDPSKNGSGSEKEAKTKKRKFAPRKLDASKTVKRSRDTVLCKLDHGGDSQMQAGRGNNGQYNTFQDSLSPDGFDHTSYDRFPWLQPDQIRDANGRRPNQEGYDPNTINLPEGFFKKYNVTEGQKQWWQFKSQHYDAVLFFKMGKFYELYEMDAHVGVEVLGLTYMKGNRPHCGFPEASYHQNAETLARAGYKVLVVEQTETPEMLKERNEKLKKARKPTSKVVQREKVAILTKGTLRDAQMVQSHPDPAYLMAIIEISPVFEIAKNGSRILGMCAVDVASNHVLFGQFCDDDLMGNLRTHVAALQPTELLLPQGENFLSSAARKFVSNCPNNPRKNILPVGEKGFLSPLYTIKYIEEYFDRHLVHFEDEENMESRDVRKPIMPEGLKMLIDAPDDNVAVLHALGAIIGFLKNGLMDTSVIPLSKFERLDDSADQGLLPGDCEGPRRIILDSSALENLEIIQNSEGESRGSLLSILDQCKTPFGRRLLRQWLSRPLGRVSEIRERQKAVQDLTGIALECAGNSSKVLSGIGDLERALARLHTSTLGGTSGGRDADHVILYEDSAKRKVKALVGAIRGLESAQEAVMEFQDVRCSLTSELLRSIVTPGCVFPDVSSTLSDIATAADWSLAEETGRVIPLQGKVPEYDAAKENVAIATSELQSYLENLKSRIGKQVAVIRKGLELSNVLAEIAFGNASCGECDSLVQIQFAALIIRYSHLVEVSDALERKVPSDFELVAQKKNCKRYMTPELRPLVRKLDSAKEVLEKEMANILQGFERRFASQHHLWSRAVDATSQLDALMCLAAAALSMEGCCPEFVESGTPTFKAQNLRHPCVSTGGFVPNNVELGGESAPLILLTGPNMGGKSTLIRQVCLATVLAQVGAFVPADSLQLSPVDAIFVRMGARDHILSNQSTFFVELSETAGMLRKATKHSLVALDELGRGTATSDGAAIASAVLNYVTNTICCRGLFATHYHDLAREHSSAPSVSVKHMACRVTPPNVPYGSMDSETSGRTADEVTFLYKLAEGGCPKSYGTNVARLAGLPEEVIEMANELSEDMERRRCRSVEKFEDAITKLRAWKSAGGSSGRVWETLRGVIAEVKHN